MCVKRGVTSAMLAETQIGDGLHCQNTHRGPEKAEQNGGRRTGSWDPIRGTTDVIQTTTVIHLPENSETTQKVIQIQIRIITPNTGSGRRAGSSQGWGHLFAIAGQATPAQSPRARATTSGHGDGTAVPVGLEEENHRGSFFSFEI